jgi:integrase
VSTAPHRAKLTKSIVMRPVAKGRKPNCQYRTREHLTEAELAKLLNALKQNRHGHRDWLVALMIYRHGLRVSEACDVRWDDIDLAKRTIIIRRATIVFSRHGVWRSALTNSSAKTILLRGSAVSGLPRRASSASSRRHILTYTAAAQAGRETFWWIALRDHERIRAPQQTAPHSGVPLIVRHFMLPARDHAGDDRAYDRR